jgi:ferrous iron transport protein B
MKIALAGNPNCGKTTIYNALTGKNERVGNWAGVTIDIRESLLKEKYGQDIKLVDLPGAYSIRPFTSEEGLTSDFIINEAPDVIINVVDSMYLSKSLFFTTQLLELNIPVIIALNKADLAESKTEINIKQLEDELKCPVVSIVALKEIGLDHLIIKARSLAQSKRQDTCFTKLENTELEQQDKARLELVNKIVTRVEKKKVDEFKESFEDKVDKFVLNPVIGIGLFIVIMSVIFNLSINSLGAFIADFIVGYIEAFQGFIADSLTKLGVDDFLNAVLTDGIIGGFGAVMGFIPLIMVLMFCLALIEDSGFMARIAVIFDPLFKKIGLSGRSIIPMIVGYGCSIPGVMASRTIKDEKQRRMTALLTPFVPCGAKVPIIALFLAAFFPEHGFLFALTYLIAFIVIILVGLFIKAVTGANVENTNYFIMELPEYRIPSVKRAFIKMVDTGKEFIIRAGTIIVLCNTIIFTMASFDFKLNLVEEAVNNSILAHLATPFAFLLIPLGFGVWQLAAAAITGFIAKEEVVGTLAVVYAMGAAINDEFALTDAVLLRETMGISAVAALAFMYFNLFTPPCFAAIGAMKTELKSRKWFAYGIMLQIGVGYFIAMVVYQVGSIIAYGKVGEGFTVSIIILIGFITLLIALIAKNKRQLSLAFSK